MTKTHSRDQLLIVALQDLADAELAWTEHSDDLARDAGPALARFLKDHLALSRAQRDRLIDSLRGLDAPIEGDPNIWLRAIIDDARRDVRSTVAGPLRDVALIGAFRKGAQAERVSYETAIVLAKAIGDGDMAVRLTQCRDEEQAADDQLAALLSPTVEAA